MKKTWKKTRALIDLKSHLGVPLSNGSLALVDYIDRHVVEGWNWNAFVAKSGSVYACRKPTGAPRIGLHTAILGKWADHKNGDTLDCRRSNLRSASKSENARNRRIGSSNSSGYKGVSLRKDRGTWLASIRLADGKLRKIGTFAEAADAARAYDTHAREVFGEFAFLNFPVDGERGLSPANDNVQAAA